MIRSSAVMRPQVQTREIEVASLLALVAAMLVLAAASLSVLWFGRIG
jgi:Ca-activated chloride channel family protein